MKNHRVECGRAKVSRKCKYKREGRGETIDEKGRREKQVEETMSTMRRRARQMRKRLRREEGRDEGRPALSSNKVEVRAASDDD